MSELRAPVLFLDTASPEVHVGVSPTGVPASVRWHSSPEEAGVSLFELIDRGLSTAGLQVDSLASIVLCEGPGSMLGIRLAAMACRTWHALPREHPLDVFAFRSLELIAASLLADGVGPPFSIIADARRNTWNRIEVHADGTSGEIERIAASELQAGGAGLCFVPKSFPRWQELPTECQAVDYTPRRLDKLVNGARLLLRPCPSPDAFVTEKPTYRPWDPTQRPTMPVPRNR